ncbi:hypothetical protein KAFR_0A02940 [Kazachstania africana CBS 2517]|uniref:RFX-type winged-helix domain-containing protein n=1 Tax=Kazachstania africana (strain ATCC 22294 / BCRC 22015 / CBS 2517 / CECT 1963 / NBRC 1671 / NRRL Y-8276) TaxID=1071382 RepID=H2AMY0_KAZAF|nr:hypothetical protein KAFR_0A02940 [Kazachstania africana CBS 2517]CCF55730.1 hypothetical protein KAFR_0A02940 [Kazachstania africana CBS 2517]
MSNISVTNSPIPVNNSTPNLTPTPGTLNENDTHNSFQSVIPIPINVTRLQSNGIITGLAANPKSLQYSLSNLNIFQTLPKETSRGVDDLTRMKMAILSGLTEEIKWSLKKYLAYSNKAPYMINLKNLPELLDIFKKFILDLKPIIENLNNPIINNSSIMDDLQNGLNCLLILRNLAQDTDSIQILVKDNEIKDFLLFVLTKYELNHKPHSKWQIYESNRLYVNELIHYTIDLMEAISTYIAPAKKDDPYFQKLVSILNFTKDRYMVISLLRSLSRLLVRSKADEESAADNLDDKTLQKVVSFILIETDADLITASLDFLYQYILPGNQRINKLLDDHERFSILSTMIPKLLSYNVKLPNYSELAGKQIKLVKRIKAPPPVKVPELSDPLFQELLQLNEPMRSTAWLRCCFDPIKDAEFTQIQLWRSYESKFSKAVHDSGRKLLPAVEFIKNVSNAFHNASAMVITDPVSGKKRFVIRGIQPRKSPLSIEDGEIAAKNPLTKQQNNLNSKFIDEQNKMIKPVKQETLPKLVFPTELSEVSKTTATFLCLISNNSKGKGHDLCKQIKPVVLHKLADIPPLSSALSEYMDNIPSI